MAKCDVEKYKNLIYDYLTVDVILPRALVDSLVGKDRKLHIKKLIEHKINRFLANSFKSRPSTKKRFNSVPKEDRIIENLTVDSLVHYFESDSVLEIPINIEVNPPTKP